MEMLFLLLLLLFGSLLLLLFMEFGKTSLVSIPMLVCLHFLSLSYHTPPHTPLISKTPQTPLHPHFSGTIFGKYTHLFR